MKIVHIVPMLTKGGAERVVVELANQACAAGHEVTVLAAFPVNPEWQRNALRPEVEVRFISPSARTMPLRYAALLGWLASNRRWVLGQDVAHCHLTFGAIAGTAIQWLRRLSGGKRPRVVETFHGVGMPIAKSRRALSSALAAGRDGYALMAQDEYWRRFIDRHPDLPVAIIANGITTEIEQPSEAERATYRATLGIPAGALVVGAIGRIVAERMPLVLVRVFAEIARRMGPEVHFLMGGEGGMTDEVRAEAERLGLGDRLHLPGLVAHPPLPLSIMDLYVSVNVGPTTGIAGLEAAASGVAMIALQSIAGYSAGGSDWIWSSSDPAALADEAARLLRAPEARQELARTQQRHVRTHFSSGAMLKAYEALYARAGATGAG
jgi:glycosyltransferase involved in cell wall biosynthesis